MMVMVELMFQEMAALQGNEVACALYEKSGPHAS